MSDYGCWERFGPVVIRWGRCGGKLWWDFSIGRLLLVRW